jgi:hypothetical protein
MSPSSSVGYDYVGNSQFPRLVFYQPDKQPYGLHTQQITKKDKTYEQ